MPSLFGPRTTASLLDSPRDPLGPRMASMPGLGGVEADYSISVANTTARGLAMTPGPASGSIRLINVAESGTIGSIGFPYLGKK